MEKIKVAYIDYTTYGTLMVLQLRENGIDLVGADSLDDFLSRHDLKEFPVLLIHPGRSNQPLVPKIVKDFLCTVDLLIHFKEKDSKAPFYLWVDDAKIQSCFLVTDKLERALLK